MSSLIHRHHFQSGMRELVNFAQSLLESQSDHHAIQKVQSHIERAFQYMKAAVDVANGELRSVDNQSMSLVAEKKRMEDAKNGQKQQLSYLRNQLEDYRSSERKARDMLATAQRHLEEMNQRVAARRREAEQSTLVRNIGIGVLVVGTLLNPVVGTIAGSVLVGCGQVALEGAENAAKKAEEAVRQHREEVSRYEAETSSLHSQIWKAENDIATAENRIQSITSQQYSLASRQAEIVRFQGVLRKCVHFLGRLAGKVSVADTLCRDILIYAELENVLEDILQLVFPLTGQGNAGGLMVLSSAEIRGLIWKLRSAREGLRALTNGQTSNAISYFT